MKPAHADWVLKHVLAPVPNTHLPDDRCWCQGRGALSCCPCRADRHETCHGYTFDKEGHIFNARFSWPPLADLWLAGRLCKKPCACLTCHPTTEQLNLFAATA